MTMRKLLKMFLKHPKVHGYLRRTYAAVINDESVKESRIVATDVIEISPIQVRKSNMDKPRLNLLVPALSVRHLFGGISTALNLFSELGKNSENLRIILTDEANFRYEDNVAYRDWQILGLDDEDLPGKTIVSAADRSSRTLAVSEKDVFITTAWWTVVLLKGIFSQRRALFGEAQTEKYVYLIQDYEPGFYPWSSRYALSESTYHDKDNCIAVFNSQILRDFFLQQGYTFRSSYYFDPVLHHGLRKHLGTAKSNLRERKVLVYGRPGVERNAFEMIVMALRLWAAKHPQASWRFYSAGEKHPRIMLGEGHYLESLGKLTIDEYATALSTSYAGLSLMISPHPSYPPLEMAAFGVRVVTNGYASKDISALSANIFSVDCVSPDSIAQMLDTVLQQYELDSHSVAPTSEWFERYSTMENPFEGIASAIYADLM
jgi:O-antigen biosynthesis protein